MNYFEWPRALTPVTSRLITIAWPWETIDSIGQSQRLRQTSFFLFLTPIAASVLSRLPKSIEVPVFEQDLTIVLSLPFSWSLLFWAAVSSGIASIIYTAFCPDIVRRFHDFPEFAKSERDYVYIRSQLDLAENEHKSSAGTMPDKVGQHYGIRFDPQRIKYLLTQNNSKIARQVEKEEMRLRSEAAALAEQQPTYPYRDDTENKEIDESRREAWDAAQRVHVELGEIAFDVEADAFYFARDCMNRSKPEWRAAATVFYCLSFAAIAVVLLQSAWFVIKIVFR
ncbi:MAG: hypothetical protein AAF532_12295 [Planctomycetota bacterium]